MSSDKPPLTPPKDPKPLPQSPTLTPPTLVKKYRSTSFSNLLRPASIISHDDKSASSSSGATEKEGGKLSAKLKDLLHRDKRPSSSSLLYDATSKILSTDRPSTPKSAPVTIIGTSDSHPTPPDNALEIAILEGVALFDPVSSIPTPVIPTSLSGADEFREAIETAEISVDRMQKAAVWLGPDAQGLYVAGAWVPMVGHGVQAVVTMLEMSKEIGVAKVSALRLVERCADILAAVLNKMKFQHGQSSLASTQDIDRLLTRISTTSSLLTKLANRPFLDIRTHAGEIQDQIAEATSDIDVFFNIFHVDAALTTDALLGQARNDREADRKILKDMMDAGIEDETVLSSMC